MSRIQQTALEIRNTSTTTKTWVAYGNSHLHVPGITSGGVYVSCIYTHAKSVTVGDSCLFCCTCVSYFDATELTPLCVDSAQALWAPFCLRFMSSIKQLKCNLNERTYTAGTKTARVDGTKKVEGMLVRSRAQWIYIYYLHVPGIRGYIMSSIYIYIYLWRWTKF